MKLKSNEIFLIRFNWFLKVITYLTNFSKFAKSKSTYWSSCSWICREQNWPQKINAFILSPFDIWMVSNYIFRWGFPNYNDWQATEGSIDICFITSYKSSIFILHILSNSSPRTNVSPQKILRVFKSQSI